jgi:hypothetical protein
MVAMIFYFLFSCLSPSRAMHDQIYLSVTYAILILLSPLF